MFVDDSISDAESSHPAQVSDEESVELESASVSRSSSVNAQSDISGSRGIKVISSSSAEYFDKRPYCYFCGEAQTQIQRHWMAKHGNEAEVKQLAELTDKSDRIECVTVLRNKGNHRHNCDVLRTGRGEFLVTHRPKPGASADDYRPCESCWCYLRKTKLCRHRCKVSGAKKGRVAGNAYLLLPAPSGTSVKVHQSLSGVVDGDVRRVAEMDSLVRKRMQEKAYVRHKVRQLARFLITIRKQDGMRNRTLDDCVSTVNFKKCVRAVRELAKFDGNPAVALRLGRALAKVAQIVKQNAVEARNEDRVRDAELFAELCRSEWSDTTARQPFSIFRERKRNEVSRLPSSADVQELNQFLVNASGASMNKLQDSGGKLSRFISAFAVYIFFDDVLQRAQNNLARVVCQRGARTDT